MPDGSERSGRRESLHARRMSIAGAVAIVLFTVLAYWPVMHAGFIWDDDSYVTQNRLLHDFDGLRRLWRPKATPQYYPVVFTSFWMEYQFWGDHPLGYHLMNVLLHAANALLVWRLCVRIGVPAGWFIAAVFALHPGHVESVAWVTERKNVLSGFFYLIAALAYLRFDDRRASNVQGAWQWYAAALATFVLALLSKTVTCSLPAALILIMLFQRKPLSAARLAPLIPMFAIGLVLALNTAFIERAHVGAHGEEFAFTFAERVLIASNALLFYPYKLLVPWPVMFIYPRWTIYSTDLAHYWPVPAVLIIAAACVVAYRRGWRGPALAIAFYTGTIFPALGFINVYPMRFSFVADHFQYLASLGVLSLLVAAASAALPSAITRRAIAAVVLAVLGVLTFRQSRTYESAETVYRDTLSKNNEAWMPHNNLANIVIQRNPVEAELHYREALRIKPDHYTAQSNLAEAVRRQGRYDDAVAEIRKAIDLVQTRMAKAGQSRPPRYLATDFVQLGQLEMARGNFAAAEKALAQAIAIDPQLTPAHHLLEQIREKRHHQDG